MEFSTIRIDVILKSGSTLYFFVAKEDEKWDPFWGRLYAFLCSFWTSELTWKHSSGQDVYLAKRELAEKESDRLLEVLGSAPEQEKQSHKTLNITLRRQARPTQIVFFAPDEYTAKSGPPNA